MSLFGLSDEWITFFLSSLTISFCVWQWPLMVIDFCVFHGNMWAEAPGILLKRSWISLSLLLSPHCAPWSLFPQQAICVPFCSCYLMAVVWEHKPKIVIQPERQTPVNFFVFFVHMELCLLKLFFSFAYFLENLSHFVNQDSIICERFLLTDGPL